VSGITLAPIVEYRTGARFAGRRAGIGALSSLGIAASPTKPPKQVSRFAQPLTETL
jgi:hypothetical protein